MIDLLEFIIIPLLSKKEALQITQTEGNYGGITYTINVDKDDLGVVIGKGGKIIRAIRACARVRAMQDQTQVTIHLNSENNLATT